MDWHGMIILQKRAKEVEYTTCYLIQRGKNGTTIWTGLWTVQWMFFRAKGDHSFQAQGWTQIQGHRSKSAGRCELCNVLWIWVEWRQEMILVVKWRPDSERPYLSHLGAGTLSCMERALSRWISSYWERNNEGAARERGEKLYRKLWNFVQQVFVGPPNMSGNVLGALDKIGRNPILCGVQCCCCPDKTRRAWAKLARMEKGQKWQPLVTH